MYYSGNPDASDALVDRLQAIYTGQVVHEKPAKYQKVRDMLEAHQASACLPYYCTYLHDCDGKLVGKYSQFSRSFVRQMVDILWSQMDPSIASVSTLDTSNTSRAMVEHANNFSVNAASATTTYGIVWGTGTGAESVSDKALGTLIAHGTGAGQLSYGGCSVGSTTTGASDTTITITRSATNSSGSTITSQEHGVYMRGGSTPWFFCTIRDLATNAITNTHVITTVYTLDFAL